MVARIAVDRIGRKSPRDVLRCRNGSAEARLLSLVGTLITVTGSDNGNCDLSKLRFHLCPDTPVRRHIIPLIPLFYAPGLRFDKTITFFTRRRHKIRKTTL
jgi:hypothetical protein